MDITMRAPLTHNQGMVRVGSFLIAATTIKMFTRTCTMETEKTNTSRLVIARPSRTPPVSMSGNVRYQMSKAKYSTKLPTPINTEPEVRVRQKQQLCSEESSIVWYCLHSMFPSPTSLPGLLFQL